MELSSGWRPHVPYFSKLMILTSTRFLCKNRAYVIVPCRDKSRQCPAAYCTTPSCIHSVRSSDTLGFHQPALSRLPSNKTKRTRNNSCESSSWDAVVFCQHVIYRRSEPCKVKSPNTFTSTKSTECNTNRKPIHYPYDERVLPASQKMHISNSFFISQKTELIFVSFIILRPLGSEAPLINPPACPIPLAMASLTLEQ